MTTPPPPPTDLVWTHELVNRFWDAVANSSLKDLSFARINGEKLLDFLAPHLPARARVVDIGAGDGDFAHFMLDRGYKVAALEPSPERRQALTDRLGGKPGFLGVLSQLAGDSFDVAIVMEVIEHVLEPEFSAFLESVGQAVRPGGLLVVTTPNSENLDYAKVFCPVSNLFFHPWQHQRRFTPATLEKTLEPYGFTRAYMALVDFSNDAPVYEVFRSMAHSAASTSTREMVRLLALQQHEVNTDLSRLLKEARTAASPETGERLVQLAAALEQRLVLQKKVIATLLKAQHLDLKTTLSLATDTLGTTDALRKALEAYRIALGNTVWQEVCELAQEATHPPPECDGQIGRGTTIIYIAQKSAR